MPKRQAAAQDYIVPLDMNGLSGRMLHMPAPDGKKTEVLFVYGQHSSLERWWGLLKYINRYAAITAPDLPGFGGMESFYKIGEKPTIDNFANYLAAFIKMRYKRKKVVIVGMSLGLVIATRMLQLYPELKGNVRMLVSLAGMAHYGDFRFSRTRYVFYRSIATIFSFWLPAIFFRYVCLNSFTLRHTYHRTYQAKHKFAAAKDREEHNRFMAAEIDLWHRNDVRTHAQTLAALLTLNICTGHIDLPFWNVTVDGDQYLDNGNVEKSLRSIFPKAHFVASKLPHHAPSIIADEAAAAPLIPAKLRQALQRLG